jgi:hypothetical protein
MTKPKNQNSKNPNPLNLSKSAILDLIERALHETGVSNKLRSTLVRRIEDGLKVYSGDFVDQEFAYELIYSFRHLLQHGIEHFGARPGRKFKPVDIETFVCSSNYMGQKDFVRPAIMHELRRLFDKDRYYFHEVVLGGAIGIGKNYFTDMALSYVVYDLSSYYSPQLEFGLAPGSSIILMLQSASIKLAKAVLYNQFRARLALCPYFTKHFPFDKKVKTALKFPNSIEIMPLASTDTAALGLNIFGGAIDELSFMPVIQDSKKGGKKEIYDQAETLYNTVIRRMESRFMILGKLPGKLFLIGSASSPGNFIDKKIQNVKLRLAAGEQVNTFVMSMPQWEALPKERFSGKTFKIELPNESTNGRILEKDDVPTLGAEIIDVPIEYKPRFKEDFDGAIRDTAGIAVGTISKFIRDAAKITIAAEKHVEMFEGKQLFQTDQVDQRLIRSAEDLVNMQYIIDHLDSHTKMGVHIDLALTGCSLGLCIGRVFGFTRRKSQDPNNASEETLPIFCIDGAIEVIPPPNREIDLFAIRDLVLFLKQHLNLYFANLDSYESAMMMQSFRAHRISSTVQSVDRTPQPYKDFKTAILTERILYPNNPTLVSEIRGLYRNPTTGKIEKPQGGSKDVSDCAAGIVYKFSYSRASYRQGDTGRPTIAGNRPQGGNRKQNVENYRRIRTQKSGRLV